MIKYKFINDSSIEPIDYSLELAIIKSSYEKALLENAITDSDVLIIKSKKKSNQSDKDLITLRLSIEDKFSDMIDKLNKDYVGLIDTDIPTESLTDLDIPVPVYSLKNNSIIRNWKIVKNDPSAISYKIDVLKSELAKSDINILKCYEAKLIDKDFPYDVTELVSSRQSKRDEINRLGALIV